MPLNLEDFKKDKLTLSDFEDQPKEGAVLGKRTSTQLAATGALISGEGVSGYQMDMESIRQPETRQAFIDKHRDIRTSLYEDAKQGLADYLADPLISDEDKVAATTWGPDNINVALDTMRTLAENAIAAPADVNETPAGEKFRFSMVDTINEAHDFKRRMQARINDIRQERNPSVAGTVLDAAEVMAPFAEWIHYDNLQRDLTEGSKNWNLMGTQKEAVFSSIQSMTIDQRAAVVDSIISTVTDNEDVVLPDGNDLVLLDTLEKMFVENDYSNFERWFDNVVSILEITGVGGLAYRTLKAPVKVAKEASKAAKDLKAAEETLQAEADAFRPAQAEETALGQEAKEFTPEAEPTEKDLFPEWMDPEARKGWDLEKEAKGFKGSEEPTAEQVFRRSVSDATRSEVDPISPSQVVKDVNPQASREMHELVVRNGDEAAEALYGTKADEAISKDLLPETSVDGRLPNKTEIKPTFEEPAHVKKARLADGNTSVSVAEVGKFITKRLMPSLKEIEGAVLHENSLVINTNDDATIKIIARYSPTDHGYSTGQEALETVQSSLGHIGLPEEAFQLYKKNKQGDWVKTTETNVEGEYSVVLDYDYRFRPEDLTEPELLTTGGIVSKAAQFLGRAPSQFLAKMGQGSLVQNLLDPHSVIHPQIVNAASVASDKAYGMRAIYIEQFEEFTKSYAGLSKDRKAMMTDYINEANFEGLKFDVGDLYRRGFTRKEIEALKVWRRANDAMWYAANADMVKTLRAQGYEVMVHKGNDTKLLGKSVDHKSVKKDTQVYNVADDINTTMTDEMRDAIENGQARIMKLGEPVEQNGRVIEYAYAKGTPSGGYVRKLADEEVVLSYRDGYYPVMYDANYIIKKHIVTEDGRRVGERVIATAKSRKEIDDLFKKVKREEGLTDEQFDLRYSFRKDRRLEGSKNAVFDEGTWSLASNSGISNQRVRGQRLADAAVDLHKRGHTNLKDPLEAVANQIHSVSQRVAMRDVLDKMKQRWIMNYGKYLELPDNKMPNSISGVVGKSNAPQAMVADARNNFNYIYSLENGYINGVDEAYRTGLHMLADYMAEIGLTKAEKALLGASGYSPSSATKGAAFKLLISSNPIRQAFVQRTQMLTLAAANPTYSFKQMAKDLWEINKVRMGVSKDVHYINLVEELKGTGVLEAVDAHNLVRTDHLKLADLTFAQRARSVAGAPLRFMQWVGFDAAEQDVLMSSYLAFRDKAIKAGKNIKDQRVKDEVLGQARAYMLNMNRSGEMAYSQNTLGVPAQFFSFQHKAFLQTLSNKSLTGMDKAKLLGLQTALFGMEATIFAYVVDAIFGREPSEHKDVARDGLLDTTLNATLSALTGEKQAIDWGDLAPSNAYGIGNVLVGLASTDLSDLIVNSPAGSLLFGGNPRIQNAMKTGMRYFVPGLDYEDPLLDTRATDVIKASLHLFSGYSNGFKANYAFRTGKAMSSSGRFSDVDVTSVEALMMTLGFRTKDQEGTRQMYEKWYGNDRRTFDSDVDKWYADLKNHVARRGQSPAELEMQGAILGEAWRVFGEDRPRAMEVITKLMEKDAKAGDHMVINGLLNQMGLMEDKDLWKLINRLPDNDMRRQMTDAMKMREEMINGSIRD